MKRLEFLDGLRGLAALYVIVNHVPLILSPQLEIPELIKPFVWYGWSGVELFFVISGFSLSMTMPKHYRSELPMVSYAISRLSRIAPLFYFLFAYNVLLAWIVHGWVISPDRALKNLLFLFNLFPEDASGVVGASWTIGAEMLFYSVFPLVYLLAKDVWRALAIAILAWGASSLFFGFLPDLHSEFTAYRNISIVTHFATFVLGIAAYLATKSLSAYSQRDGLGRLFVAIGVAGICWLMIHPKDFPLLQPSQSPGIFYALIIVGLGLAPLAIIANPVLQFYGRICYSVYLWHPPVIFALEPLLQRVRSLGYDAATTLLICYAITFTVVTIVATISHYLIEVPGLKLGLRIKKAISAAHQSRIATAAPAE